MGLFMTKPVFKASKQAYSNQSLMLQKLARKIESLLVASLDIILSNRR